MPACYIKLIENNIGTSQNTDDELMTFIEKSWDEIVDSLKNENCLLGCGRWIKDPANDNSSERRGITLGNSKHSYHKIFIINCVY